MAIMTSKIVNKVQRVYYSLVSSPFKLVLFLTSISLLIHVLIVHIIFYSPNPASSCTSVLRGLSLGEEIIIAGFVAPAIETIIFHFLLLEFLLFVFKRIKYKYFPVIIISAIIFSLSHRLEVKYLLNSFFGGIVLSGSYLIAKNRFNIPVAIPFCIHSLFNLSIIIMNRFLF